MNFDEIIDYIIKAEQGVSHQFFSAKVFIEKFGVVNDKDLAIEMIILNPYTIEVLSPDLQNDKDVLIYFFPYRMSGRYLLNGYQTFSNSDPLNIANVDKSNWEIHQITIFPANPNLEFGIKTNHHNPDVRDICLISNRNNLLDEEFIKNYNQVLRELITLSFYILEKTNHIYVIDTTFDIIIDRTKIKKIVREYMQKGKSPIMLRNKFNDSKKSS